MKTGLQLKLAQHLTLTPQLQQSIRLLQLSTLELQQEITTALAENPLLELEDIDDPVEVSLESLPTAPEREVALERGDEGGFDIDDAFDAYTAPSESSAVSEVSIAESATSSDDASPSDAAASDDAPVEPIDVTEWGNGAAGDGDDDGEWQRARNVSLHEHLRSQVAMVRESPSLIAVLNALIDALDDDGMLDMNEHEFAAMLGVDVGSIATLWQRALHLLQRFDPPGVGARSLQECLSLQLSALPQKSVVKLARRVVDEAFDALARRDFVRIRKLYSLTEPALRDVLNIIQSLSPRPGAPFADVSASQLVPDVIVRRNKSRWYAELNGAVVPRLTVNTMYADMLQRQKEGRATPLSTQLQEARWLVKNVAQRFETILRVAIVIVERQQAFFDHGAVAMRPLVLREVADELGLHESTVSRVTTQKFLTSVQGTFEFKHFFGSHVATDAGGAASSTAIRAMIKTLISEEDLTQPLTDSRIAELLGEQGIIVARRTVAKYREQQQIDPVNQRRRD
ncbi:MAG: RNA polymerase factor sigma-54 [Betaproteobacteria bacterium]|nr:MAG: RNA polymerase factor sigma-54 [Betaproteobacteria bacterium]